jgi:DNA segregation ATPase FtsK/SpoIIIE, S-DNA-T family
MDHCSSVHPFIMAVRRRTRRRAATTRKRKPATRRRKNQGITLDIGEHVSREILGIFWIGFSILNFLALYHNAGSFGLFWEDKILSPLFGIGSLLVPLIFLITGLALLTSTKIKFGGGRSIGITLLIISALGLIQLSAPEATFFESAPEYGGYLGFITDFVLFMVVGSTATTVILGCSILIALLLIFDISFNDLFTFLSTEDHQSTRIARKETKVSRKDLDKIELPDESDLEDIEPDDDYVLDIIRGGNRKDVPTPSTMKEMAIVKNIKGKAEDILPDAIDAENKADYSKWEFPALDLLQNDKETDNHNDDDLLHSAELIKKKLEQFNIHVTMKEAHVGPTVIQYTLKPAAHIKLSKITSLKNDLALALSAQAIRIEAPIPGKGLVGIEVPAKERSTVMLKNIMASPTFHDYKGMLKLTLGRDVSGMPIVADLTTMPHLLVAGQTGAGKSIGINSFIISLLYQQNPRNLRLIMIDPKQVELSVYNGIPHLLTPVITSPDKALQALKWAVSEMNRRYKELSTHGKRNILEYNETYEDNQLPYVVIIIDELADLMMAASKEIEATVCRIAQMARAVGIHLIVATQRPSVDVITGLIKANIPTRIAFTVATGIDSRTIIDTVGAEDLLGKGDMLFLDTHMSKPLRVQGAFISAKEVEKVINAIKLNAPEGINYDNSITEDEHQVSIPGLKSSGPSSEGDSDLQRAIEAIREGKKASASFLQRRCSFGYAKAARILDELEEMGIVGPSNGAKPRAIFIENAATAEADDNDESSNYYS